MLVKFLIPCSLTLFINSTSGVLLRYNWQSSRDRIVVSTLRCGRNNPGSNPGHGSVVMHYHGMASCF